MKYKPGKQLKRSKKLKFFKKINKIAKPLARLTQKINWYCRYKEGPKTIYEQFMPHNLEVDTLLETHTLPRPNPEEIEKSEQTDIESRYRIYN